MYRIYRFIGRNGRTTIPASIRRALNIGKGDLVGYRIVDHTVVISKEKVCNNCRNIDSVEDIASTLTPQERKEMLTILLKQARRG